MFDTLLIAVLLTVILFNFIPKLFPIIEGNTTTDDALSKSQEQAGVIQYLKDTLQKTLDALGGDINDLYTQLDTDVTDNAQNISDYQAAVSQNTDPYSSGAYTETGNAPP